VKQIGRLSAVLLMALALGFLAPVAQVHGEPASPTTPTEWEVAQQRFLNWNRLNTGWVRTADGLQYNRGEVLHPDAASPMPGCPVTIDYEGRLITGALFDASSAHRGPVTFPLKGLIKGWQEGVPLMHVGETFEFAIPSDLAYRKKWFVQDGKPFVSIPADSALLFKIELIALPPC
jgi:FKBP-type peptidyl-prolyl cis-trans isomerase FkpA